MPFAVELALDPDAAAAVRDTWQALARAGIDYMATCGARPHVSLGIWEEMDVPAAADALRAFARAMAPLPVTFERVARFPGGVVYLAPRFDARLVAVQARLHAALTDGRGGWPHYQPGVWIPHCTMAMDYPPRLEAVAGTIAESTRLPLQARLGEIGIVQFRPVRTRFTHPLGGPATPSG